MSCIFLERRSRACADFSCCAPAAALDTPAPGFEKIVLCFLRASAAKLADLVSAGRFFKGLGDGFGFAAGCCNPSIASKTEPDLFVGEASTHGFAVLLPLFTLFCAKGFARVEAISGLEVGGFVVMFKPAAAGVKVVGDCFSLEAVVGFASVGVPFSDFWLVVSRATSSSLSLSDSERVFLLVRKAFFGGVGVAVSHVSGGAFVFTGALLLVDVDGVLFFDGELLWAGFEAPKIVTCFFVEVYF